MTGDITQKNISAFAFIDLTPVTFANVSSEKYDKTLPCILHYIYFADAVVGKSSFSSKPQFSSGQTYGEKSETEGGESNREEELSLSDIEKKLLLLYPGESKHLDDSQVEAVTEIYANYIHVLLLYF